MNVQLAVRQEPRGRQDANVPGDRVSRAVQRQLTIRMWRDICTHNLREAPADDRDPRREEVDHG